MANLYSSFVNILDLSINSLKENIMKEKDENLQALYAKMISSFEFMASILSGKINSYSDMIKFQNTMAALESLFMTYPMSNYEKGQLIRKFLTADFEQSPNNPITLIYDKAILDFSNELNMPVKETENYLEKYFNNYSQGEIPSEIEEQIKVFLERLKQENINFVQKYHAFKNKYLNIDVNFDFKDLKERFSELKVPTNIVNYYYDYCKEIYDKKAKKKTTFVTKETIVETKNEHPYSKKELKKRLLKYCDLLKDKQFDYENYDEVLKLLSYLELADNVNTKYFNYCYQNRITNASYYKLLLTKIKNNKKYEDEISLINWYLESIKSEEDKNAAMESIYEILKTIPELEMLNFDYEMTRIRKK